MRDEKHADARTKTLSVDVVESLGLRSLLGTFDDFLRLCRRTERAAGELARVPQSKGLPEALVRREFAKTLAAALEPQVVRAFDHTPKHEQQLIGGTLHRLASPGLEEEPVVTPNSLRWFDPVHWRMSPRTREQALVTLGYAAYYLHLHETEIDEADPTGATSRRFWEIASEAGRYDRDWWKDSEIRARLALDSDAGPLTTKRKSEAGANVAWTDAPITVSSDPSGSA